MQQPRRKTFLAAQQSLPNHSALATRKRMLARSFLLAAMLGTTTTPAIAEMGCTFHSSIWDVFSNGVRTSSYVQADGFTCARTYESRGGLRRENQGGVGRGDRGDEIANNQSGANEDTGQKTAITCPVKANPIVVATGNKVERESDFGTAGQMPLHLNRTWNQFWDGIGLFGWHWLSNYDYRLSFGTSSAYTTTGTCYARPSIAECSDTTSATDIWAHRPDGRKIHFVRNATDGVYYEDKASPISKIVRQADGTLLLTFEDNLVESYSKGGYPLYVQDEYGLRWTFTYGGLNNTQVQRVTHTNGRYVQFTWVDDELRQVSDPAGSAHSFTYTAQKVTPGIHLLKSTTRPGLPTTTISYHYSGEAGEPDLPQYALTGKSFNGARYSWFNYDGSMRTTVSEHAGNVERYSFAYTPGANGAMTVLETNPLGKQTTYSFQDSKLGTVTGHASPSCGATGSNNTYDANGYLDKVTDNNGNVTDYDYSVAGRLIQKIEGYGTAIARKTVFGWDIAKNRLTTVIVENSSWTDYTYTADNRIATVTVKNVSPNGVLNQALTTTYSYTKHPNGLLQSVTVDGPLPGTGDAVTSNYNTYGDLTSVTNSLGHATTYSNFNALGQPGRITNPNGGISEFVYDARGRITAEKQWINDAWQTTTYGYDAAGRLASKQMPDGQLRRYEYDGAWRLAREYEEEAPGVFAQKRYAYNNLSLVTRIDTERTTSPVNAPALSAPSSSSNGSYTISWAAVADTTSYVLEESVNSGPWAEVQNSSATSRIVSGKVNGTYSYRAKSCNTTGCSPYSAVVAVVVSLSGPPATPTLTSPAANSTGAYNVAWGSVPSATSYRLDESRNGGAWTEIYNAAGTSKSLTKGMSADFSYRVRACNVHGCSGYSAVRTVTVEVNSCPSCLMMSEPSQTDTQVEQGDGQ